MISEEKVQRISEFLQRELDQDFVWVLLYEQEGGGVMAGNCQGTAVAQCIYDHLVATTRVGWLPVARSKEGWPETGVEPHSLDA